MSFKEFFLLLSFAQSLLVFVSLFNIAGNRITNRLLAFHTLIWGIMCYYRYTIFQDVDYILEYHCVLRFNKFVFMMLYTCIFLYIKYMCLKFDRLEYRDLLHFLPSFIVFLLFLPFFILSGPEKVNIILNHQTLYYKIVYKVIDYVAILQGIFYFYYSLKYLKRYHNQLRENYSNIDRITLNWLRNMVIVVFGISLLGSIGMNLYAFRLISDVYFDFQYFIVGGSIFLISYYLLTKRELFVSEVINSESDSDISELEKEIGLNSDLKNVDKNQFHFDAAYCSEVISKLTLVMENDKLYLNQDLSLNDVADQINVPRHHISLILNNVLNNTFFDYINKYRVEEVKRRLQDPSFNNLTLLAIAYDAGFNSKATFNRIFKKYENLTPLEYKNSLLSSC